MTRDLAVGQSAYNRRMSLRHLRIAIQRLRVRRAHRRACRAYDRLVDLENP